MSKSILIIDDKPELLDELTTALKSRLAGEQVDVRGWAPTGTDHDTQATFNERIGDNTALVITDYDLTAHGQTGLFGSTIVAWCQRRAIPVGDFSRGNLGNLPKQPNLFEFRVPGDIESAVPFVVSVYHGFRDVRLAIDEHAELLKRRSPAAVLAEILGVRDAESQFALYAGRLAPTTGALMEKLSGRALSSQVPNADEKKSLLTYIVGHLLLNAVLTFPGPILPLRALMAYVGCDDSENAAVSPLFAGAAYAGPFSELDRFFWLSTVEQTLNDFGTNVPREFTAETVGGFNREILRRKLGRELNRHGCPRCAGINGGFICPFTKKTVCQRNDCSVGSNSWIPQGARLCRIERDFYDEWAPILGM